MSSYNTVAFLLPRLSRLNHQFLSHSWMLLCRQTHLVTSFRMCRHRRLINRTPCFRLMWQCKRLPTVSIPYNWMPAVQTTSPSALSQHVSTQMGSRSASSFSVEASVQMTARSAVLLDVATQLNLTEFLIGWICSDQPVDCRHPFYQSPPSVLGAHVAPLPPPGLEQPAPLPVISSQPQSLTNVISSHCHTFQPTAGTTNVGTHPVRPAGAKRSASTAHAGNHYSFGPCPCTVASPFPKPNAVVLPMLSFGHSKTRNFSPIATADSDIMHHQFRLSLLQWNPGPARRNPTNIVSAACGKFHAVILQEASDHIPHISDYFRAGPCYPAQQGHL